MNTENQSVGVDPVAAEHDAGLSLLDVWRSLVRRKLWVISITGALIIGALWYVFSVPSEWEAVAIIQVGQVGQVEQAGGSLLIEPPPRTLERMKLKPFAHDVLTSLGQDPNSREAELYKETLKLKVLTNTDLLELKVRGYSREQAASWAEATVAHVSKVHEVLAQPSKQRLRATLDEVKLDLQKAEIERTQLLDSLPLKQQIGPGNRFAENVLFANMISTAERQMRGLQAQKRALEEQLSPVKTYPTSLIDRVYVPERRAFPKRSLIIGLAGVIGLLLGGFMALAADALRRSALKPMVPAQIPARGDGHV